MPPSKRSSGRRGARAAAPTESFRRPLAADELRDSLVEGLPVELLHALGLVDPSGRSTADSARKIKQINHFIRLVQPALDDVFARHENPVLVDAAAGKSYLGMAIYAVACHRHGRGELHAIESRDDLNDRVRDLARRMDYARYHTVSGRIADAELPERVHFVVALHACDTATDEALVRALQARSDHVALVPCCQAELARLWKRDPPTAYGPLVRHAWHRREFGAHATNVLRSLALEAHGYQTTVTELAGWEHAVKNELILARRVGRFHRPSQTALRAYTESLGVRPWLLDALDTLEASTDATPDPGAD